VILATLLEGASVRDLLPYNRLFHFDKELILPILIDIDKNLCLVISSVFVFIADFFF
jgi:hypothetical protein